MRPQCHVASWLARTLLVLVGLIIVGCTATPHPSLPEDEVPVLEAALIPGESPTTFSVRLTNKSTVPVAVCPCMGPPTRYLVLDLYHEDDPRRLSPPEILYRSAPLRRFYTCISPDESIDLTVDLRRWEPVWAGHREPFPSVDLLIGPGSYRIRARYLDNGRVRRRDCQGFSGEVLTEWVEIEVPSTEASASTTPDIDSRVATPSR